MTRDDFSEKDIGRWVIYEPEHGPHEKGRIKSLGTEVIFVVYQRPGLFGQWDNFMDYIGEATLPADLSFTTKPEEPQDDTN